MITINKAKALAPKAVPSQKLRNSALLAVACNEIMLGVCDDLKETEVYHQQTKLLINQLTKNLTAQVAKLYAGLQGDEDEQFLNVVRVIENAASLMISMTPHEINVFSGLMVSLKNGEVYVPTTEKQLENIVNQKRVKSIKEL